MLVQFSFVKLLFLKILVAIGVLLLVSYFYAMLTFSECIEFCVRPFGFPFSFSGLIPLIDAARANGIPEQVWTHIVLLIDILLWYLVVEVSFRQLVKKKK